MEENSSLTVNINSCVISGFLYGFESPATRNKINSFNGVAKTTIGRGKEEKLAGQILTFTIKESEH